MTVLAGDIGGTKCLLCLCDDSLRPTFERRYASADYAAFSMVVQKFLGEAPERPQKACFGVAGPVANDVSKTTNLPWVIDARALERETFLPKIRIINDFHATAASVESLKEVDTFELRPGTRDPKGPIAILGAGTGLGEAFLFHNGTGYQVVASEGGHADFAPRTEEEIGLLRFLAARFGGHVSYERVLSGKGLQNLYEYLRDTKVFAESEAVRAEMGKEDPPAVISRHGLAKDDPLSERALGLFVELYGAEAGNVALKVMATGGVFIAGGIAPKILERMKDGAFSKAFSDKGRLSRVLE